MCLDCILACNSKAKERDPERFRLHSLKNSRLFREAHPDKDRDYYEGNKAKILQQMKVWAENNKEKVLSIKAAYKQRNPHKRNEYERRRRAKKLGATPAWLTPDQFGEMIAIYEAAQRQGPGYQVDHIVPLMGRLVCGLHVPWNLRVIPARENCSKGNRLVDHP